MEPFAFKPTQATVRLMFIFALVLLVAGTFAATKAQAVIPGIPVYNNIPNPIPLNVFSQGPEAYAFNELGDGFTLGLDGGTLETVTVVLSSWACTSGNWFGAQGSGDACVTTPGATYPMPVTVNVYSVEPGTSLEGNPAPAPGTLLATATETFNMPYRPSSDFVNCPVSPAQAAPNYYQWYDATTQTCQDGINFPITFNLSSQKIKLPRQIIVTFVYNTSDYGPNPYGDATTCHGTQQGCFYDSLNISGGANASTFPGTIPASKIGSVLNVNGIFTSFASADTAFCGTGTANADTLELDASPGCYTGNHPMIEVTII
jgi:hypothetical protein